MSIIGMQAFMLSTQNADRIDAWIPIIIMFLHHLGCRLQAWCVTQAADARNSGMTLVSFACCPNTSAKSHWPERAEVADCRGGICCKE